VIREGGVPGLTPREQPASSLGGDSGSWGHKGGRIHPDNPGVFQHIGYPTVVQARDGTIACLYHEWTEDDRPLQYVRSTRFRLA
jgi:sialidase-1